MKENYIFLAVLEQQEMDLDYSAIQVLISLDYHQNNDLNHFTNLLELSFSEPFLEKIGNLPII